MELSINLAVTGTVVINQASAPPFTNPELWPQPDFDASAGLTLSPEATVSGGNLVFDGSEGIATCEATGIASIAQAIYEYAVNVATHGGVSDPQLIIGGAQVNLTGTGPFTGEATANDTSGFLVKDETNRSVVEIDSVSIRRKAVPLNELTAPAIPENTPEDTDLGSLSGTLPGSTLALIDDAGGRFKISGTNLLAGAVPTDYETATSHDITVRETLAEAPNSPRDTVITVNVSNVDE